MKKIKVNLTNGYCDVVFTITPSQTLITMKTDKETLFQHITLEDVDNDANNYAATITEIMADFFTDDFVLTSLN